MQEAIQEQFTNAHTYVELGRESGNPTERILLKVEDNHNDQKTNGTNHTNRQEENAHVEIDVGGATLGMSNDDLAKTMLVSHHHSKDD